MPLNRMDAALRDLLAPAWAQIDTPLHRMPVPTVRARLNAMRKSSAPPYRPDGLTAEDRTLPVDGRKIGIRLFWPGGAKDGSLPATVFFHGGGFCIGSLDTHDRPCAELARAAQTIVVSVDYRLAPEHPFPAAVEDSFGALTWVAAHPEEIGAAPGRLAVAGDSAGANLATVMTLMARDAGGPQIDYQLLFYPNVDTDFSRPSFKAFGAYNPMLTTSLVRHYMAAYLGADLTTRDWRALPLHAPSLAGLPPACVVLAELDLLLDEGRAYAARLSDDRVPVDLQFAERLPHGFLRGLGAVGSVDTAFANAAGALRTALHPG